MNKFVPLQLKILHNVYKINILIVVYIHVRIYSLNISKYNILGVYSS